MNILLIYPKVSKTFWSFSHALKIVRKKAAFPPLGALTVAAMLPKEWNKRVLDLNTTPLKDDDLKWADYVFISAMVAQRKSTEEVIQRCKRLGIKMAGGGPLFLCYHQDFPDVDHLILGEGEALLPEFISDIISGTPKKIYRSDAHPPLDKTPVPRWDLIDIHNYSTMSIQYSRGCPYDCEFCDIIVMNGRKPRTKTNEQMIKELEALYKRGWRGAVFIVDDNFIGNKGKVKKLLVEVIKWQEEKGYPFTFFTEASVDLADDDKLLELMVQAGFDKVFLGLETPEEESLQECGKYQNLKHNLSWSVRKIQKHGLAIMGGFIIGFDHDKPDIFKKQFNFIQDNGIVTAMIGLLTAIPTTRLYKRLEKEGRILFDPSGDNTDKEGSLNFIPKMDRDWIISEYQKLMRKVYEPSVYYRRILRFLKLYNKPRKRGKILLEDLITFLRSLWYMGIRDCERGRRFFWKALWTAITHYPKCFVEVVTWEVYGYHFRKLFFEER
ncbi:MAG TPA: B12-binding domain-containing radical SAM protein [Thermodesulforhabdus norvegica]|uniref:B12-binding domain-containing radical SAM protein n=1 Tax=Thermodesulforhabdus norvegica TaxID=39841 RepID=A0A7C1B220_9BACT|nr:B12-binding domain-containing radical SAM protein [Thermodesulforhabdus norvegica]